MVSISDTAAGPTHPVIGLDGTLDTAVIRVLAEPSVRKFIADQLGQADVVITFGRQTVDGETRKFTPPRHPSPCRWRARHSPARPGSGA